jgi:hypothetical protein
VHAEAVSVAVGDERIGAAFLTPLGDVEFGMQLMSVPFGFTGPSSTIEVTSGFVSPPSVRYLGGRFLVVWHERFPDRIGDAIWGRLFDEMGNPLSAATRIADGAQHARSPNALPLGDRFLLFWADDLDANYELYVKMLDNELVEMSPRERLTFAEGDSLSPIAEFGPSGELGVVFLDDRDGTDALYFLRLACAPGLF